MNKVVNKFKGLIRQLNYNQIKVVDTNTPLIKNWCISNIPKIVNQLEPLGWNLSKDETWEETILTNAFINWYGENIGVFVTSSFCDYRLAYSCYKSLEFKNLRDALNLKQQAVVLVDSTMFIEVNELDVLYENFNFKKGYSKLDLSHYDNKENIIPSHISEWSWLQSVEEDDIIWSIEQYNKEQTY